MSTDAWLAIAHHLAVFSVLALLSVEWAIVRPGLGGSGIKLLARVDVAYGASAAGVVVAGVARVIAGAKPSEFYTENSTFWFKMAAFATVGLLSIRPTIQYARWRKRLAEDGATPDPDVLRSAHRAVNTQLLVFGSIPVLAVLMSRGIGA